MNKIFYQLLRPWSYLFIKHDTKWIYDYLVPLVVTVMTAGPMTYLYLTYEIDIYSKTGLIKDIISFVATLPGFFIAALAAIATFQKNDIDEKMPSTTRMNVRMNGQDIEIELTRRRFLCSLFAFLTSQSILLCTIFFMIIHAASGLSAHIECPPMSQALAVAGLWIFFLLFWNILSSTALGLYYLGDRLHHPKT